MLSAVYSLPPIRIAKWGVLASLVLPAGFVVVPYGAGALATNRLFSATDAMLMAGLYIGFIGRILLKDFRDVRGDALFGKRTFLVRHGRRRTCAVAAVCWTAGVVILAAVQTHAATVVAQLVLLGVALELFGRLAAEVDHRREELLIAAIAIVGRGALIVVLAHLSTASAVVDGGAALHHGVPRCSLRRAGPVMATVGPRPHKTTPRWLTARWPDPAPTRRS